MLIKSPHEIELMRNAGLLLSEAHALAKKLIHAGTTTKAVDQAVDSFITKHGAYPVFKGVPGAYPYPAATCISINDEIVHGIPSERIIADGDLVSIDIGLRLEGWCADCACTYAVGNVDAEKLHVLKVTEECLRIAIQAMKPGILWSSVSSAMSTYARKQGCSVVEELIGHGIGTEMWEPPHVPNYHATDMEDYTLVEGMVLAVEPMMTAGGKQIGTKEDGWTIATQDGSPSAHFEHVIAITATGCNVLTCDANGQGWAL